MRIFIVILIIIIQAEAGSPEKLYFFGRAFVTRILTPTHENPAMGFFGGGGHLAARDAGLLSPIGGRAPPSPWVATVAGDHHRTSHPHTTQHTTLLQVQADLSYMSCGRISLRAFFML